MKNNYKRNNMKDFLCQSLYILMTEKPFEKITIKQICDKTGVIRGTFYNHFIDKYEALEYLVEQMLIGDNVFIDHQFDIEELMQNIIHVIYEHQIFFKKCFQIEGQNSFESMLQNIFCKILNQYFKENLIQLRGLKMGQEFLSSYYSQSVIFILKYWVFHNYKDTPDELFKAVKLLLTNNILYFKNNNH